MEYLRIGDVIFRPLRECSAFHYGIIYSLEPFIIADFNWDGFIKTLTIDAFLDGERVFWIERFSKVPLSMLRPVEETISLINSQLNTRRNYDLLDYNCENYAREVKFRPGAALPADQITTALASPSLQILRIIGQKIKQPHDAIAFRHQFGRTSIIK